MLPLFSSLSRSLFIHSRSLHLSRVHDNGKLLARPYLVAISRTCCAMFTNYYLLLVPNPNDEPKSTYFEYKALEKKIFALLDPEGQLAILDLDKAKQVAKSLVRRVPAESRNELVNQLDETIRLREKCGERFKFAPTRYQTGHQKRIGFLKDIQQYLGECNNDQAFVVEVIAQPPGERTTNNDKPGLTLAQEEFRHFYDSLIYIIDEAIALWTQVADDNLSIWTASVCTVAPPSCFLSG